MGKSTVFVADGWVVIVSRFMSKALDGIANWNVRNGWLVSDVP